jgi:hypothetical protein
MKIIKLLTVYALFLILSIAAIRCVTKGTAQNLQLKDSKNTFPDNAWGIYSWGGDPDNSYCQSIKGVPIVIRWSALEPEKGQFKFDQVIGIRLEECKKKGYRTFIKIYVAPNTEIGFGSPKWLFEEEKVPLVKVPVTISPFRTERHWTFPWYLDSTYLKYQYRMIGEFGSWVKALPEDLQDVILFVQSAEGSTGDGGPYKGQPLDPAYRITPDNWGKHRMEVWGQYKRALSDKNGKMIKPLLVNYDSNRGTEYNWLLENLDAVGLKNGMFSHGYDISDEIGRLEMIDNFRRELGKNGKELFIRGEQDGEWNICGWSKKNPEQAFYWSAIYAIHCGLDMWNFPNNAAHDCRFAPAMDFFNVHAGVHKANKSKYAFCTLRKGLNAADTIEFPEPVYGKADRKNVNRYLAIANAFMKYGAYQGDPVKATGTGMVNRQKDDYNDVGWNIFPGNYERFLTQIDADNTSVGWWHVKPDDGIFSRFARGFENSSGKNSLYFKLDPDFYGDQRPHSMMIHVTYFDKGTGIWSLHYVSPGGIKQVCKVVNTGKGEWMVKNLNIKDALINGKAAKGSDFILKYEDGDDTIFHMIEVERL